MACIPAAQEQRQGHGQGWPVSLPRRSSGRGMAKDGPYPCRAGAAAGVWPRMACIPAAQEQRQGHGQGWPVSLVGLRSRRPPTFPTSRWVTAQEQRQGHGQGWPVSRAGLRSRRPPTFPTSRWVTAQEQHRGHGQRMHLSRHVQEPGSGRRPRVSASGRYRGGPDAPRCGHPVPAAAGAVRAPGGAPGAGVARPLRPCG